VDSLLLILTRSIRDFPPQTPSGSSKRSAWSKHSARTGQRLHMALAWAVDRLVISARPLTLGKKSSGSSVAHAARLAHGMSLLTSAKKSLNAGRTAL
jgi:hypothetical protein